MPDVKDTAEPFIIFELAGTTYALPSRLVQQMEGGQLPLDQLLDGYRRGAELLALCRTRLQAVEEQVRLLDDGKLVPWSGE